jgi:hypothetical protein
MNGRKALVRDYKDRKVEPGIYAVRCVATGEVWVGGTPELSTRQNGVWFSLRQGSHVSPPCRRPGTPTARRPSCFETLEVIDDEGHGTIWAAPRCWSNAASTGARRCTPRGLRR